MNILNIFTVLLINLIYKIVGARYPFTVFSAGITGFLHCNYRKVGFARVMISEKPRKILEKRPVAQSFVRFGKTFYLKGRLKGIFSPYFYVKIIHNCVRAKVLQQKVYVKQIPPKYVAISGRKFYLFNMGFLELSRLEGRAE